jgi:hypothetical protein
MNVVFASLIMGELLAIFIVYAGVNGIVPKYFHFIVVSWP